MIYVALDQVQAMTLADSIVDIMLRRAFLFNPGTGKALQGTSR
jgi:ABC-type sugar transport system ATPase subunit